MDDHAPKDVEGVSVTTPGKDKNGATLSEILAALETAPDATRHETRSHALAEYIEEFVKAGAIKLAEKNAGLTKVFVHRLALAIETHFGHWVRTSRI